MDLIELWCVLAYLADVTMWPSLAQTNNCLIGVLDNIVWVKDVTKNKDDVPNLANESQIPYIWRCVAKRTVEHQDSNLDLCVRMKKSQEGEEEEGKEDLSEVQREHPASHMLYPVRSVRRYILD